MDDGYTLTKFQINELKLLNKKWSVLKDLKNQFEEYFKENIKMGYGIDFLILDNIYKSDIIFIVNINSKNIYILIKFDNDNNVLDTIPIKKECYYDYDFKYINKTDDYFSEKEIITNLIDYPCIIDYNKYLSLDFIEFKINLEKASTNMDKKLIIENYIGDIIDNPEIDENLEFGKYDRDYEDYNKILYNFKDELNYFKLGEMKLERKKKNNIMCVTNGNVYVYFDTTTLEIKKAFPSEEKENLSREMLIMLFKKINRFVLEKIIL